ncbi:MAG: metallophosphoesterase family protein [Gemmatimonadetes bacterium]|nr:metallophosphoesterase family protein [Gemmatimonadota bacterium]
MQVAVLSDIHANLPALRAVLADCEHRGVDRIYHLGDLVGYAPWPNEVAASIREAGIEGIQGNYDSTVANDHPHCGCQYDDPRERELSAESYAWTVTHTSAETKRWMGRLPFSMTARPLGGHRGDGPVLRMVHGTASLNTVYWREDRTDAFARKMLELLAAKAGDLVLFGHTHRPWHRFVDDVLLVNTGSVGRPKDGDPRAGYALVELGGDPRVEQVRVAYDVEEAARAVVDAGLPEAFAHVLRTGGSIDPN